jgi:hypothetical protein
MGHRTPARRRWRLVSLALALTLVVALAAPAAAKGPVIYPSACAPVARESVKASPRVQELCERHAVADGQGFTAGEARIVAGSVAVLVLMMAAGMLVATHRRDAPAARPTALG